MKNLFLKLALVLTLCALVISVSSCDAIDKIMGNTGDDEPHSHS